MDNFKLGMDKAYIEGLKTVNRTFKRPAGLGLNKGFAETMTTYNRNRRIIERMELELQDQVEQLEQQLHESSKRKSRKG